MCHVWDGDLGLFPRLPWVQSSPGLCASLFIQIVHLGFQSSLTPDGDGPSPEGITEPGSAQMVSLGRVPACMGLLGPTLRPGREFPARDPWILSRILLLVSLLSPWTVVIQALEMLQGRRSFLLPAELRSADTHAQHLTVRFRSVSL